MRILPIGIAGAGVRRPLPFWAKEVRASSHRLLRLFFCPRQSPVFYHGFIRFVGADNFLRYAAVEARLPGIPHFEFGDAGEVQYSRELVEGSMNFLTNIAAVVYGKDELSHNCNLPAARSFQAFRSFALSKHFTSE